MAFTIGISDETFYNIGQCVMHTKLGGGAEPKSGDAIAPPVLAQNLR